MSIFGMQVMVFTISRLSIDVSMYIVVKVKVIWEKMIKFTWIS